MRVEHVSKKDTIKHQSLPGREEKTYVIYECDYCDEEFSLERGKDPLIIKDRVLRHVEEEHPESLERDEYKNEELFREWVSKTGFELIEPKEDGRPLVVKAGPGKEIELHKDGQVVLKQFRLLGRENLEIQGNRLVAEDGGYVSPNAFPVDEFL